MAASESAGLRAYGELLSIGDVRRVVSWGVIGRLWQGMSGLALILLIRAEGGSYAAAGIVSAAFALASGAGAPVAGRLVDRHRATAVLTAYAGVFGAALLALAALAEAGSPLATLIGAAAVAGFTAPPIAATVRTMWPRIAPTPGLRATAFALEATLQEVIFVSGPLIVAGLSATISPTAGVPAAAILGSAGAIGFALTSTIRSRRPDPAPEQTGRLFRALAPADVRLTLVFTAAYGVVFGAAEVAMPAFAEQHGGRSLAGFALAAWSGGSLVGGILAASMRPPDMWARLRLVSLLFVLTLLPPLAVGSVPAMAAAMFVAGLPIAPSFALAYNLIERASVPGTQAEVFGWISTSITLGIAAGTAGGGGLIAHRGVDASLALAIAGAVAARAILEGHRHSSA
ncbi:MAG TPA: MFS transporter [Gaiellales bacterium]|nr:MFS transporter [Gaiellales bacterium]